MRISDWRSDVCSSDLLEPLVERDVVVVAPLVDAHLLADDIHHRGGADRGIAALEVGMDRDRGFVAVRDRPDDVLRAERRVAAEEHLRVGRAHGRLVDLRHATPVVEVDAAGAYVPGEGGLLSETSPDVVPRENEVPRAR